MTAKWDRSKGSPEPIAALNRVRELENGEPLVDLRIAAPSARIHRPTVIPFARQTVAEMLERAAQSLPQEFRLGVVDAWRPLSRQIRIYEWVMRCAQEAFPNRTYRELRRTVNRWAAPCDQKAPPGHCTGAAIDVWLLHENGEVADVSNPYLRFSAAPTYSLGLEPQALANRMALVHSMLGAGFSNCRDEWWHYSYGDAGWAVRSGAASCPYGLIELNGFDYSEQERLSEEALAARSNPFLTGK